MALNRGSQVITTIDGGFRPKDISNEIFKLKPDQKTLLTLIQGKNKISVDDYEYRINIQDIAPSTITMSVAFAGNVTGCTVEQAKSLRIGTTLRLNETVATYVTAVTYATGAFTVADITGFTANDIVLVGGTAAEELSNRPTPIAKIPTQVTNYVQTQRDAWGLSRHAQNTRYYGGNRYFHSREDCLFEHGRFVDRELWFGVKLEGTQNSQKLFKTSGMLASITTNVHSFTSQQINHDKVRNNMITDCRFMLSSRLWLFVSRKGAALWDKIVYDKGQPIEWETAANLRYGKIGMANKELLLFVVDHFEASMDGTMVLVEPDAIEVVTTKDQRTGQRQWMLEKRFEGDDSTGPDGILGEIMTDFGLRIDERRCAMWKDADSVA